LKGTTLKGTTPAAIGDFAPYAEYGDFRTCADLIEESKLYEIGSDDCGIFEMTCKELLDNMANVAVEAGSDLCESLSGIEPLCCRDVDSAPSPVEPLTTLPSGTTTISPTDSSSGGASVSGLVGIAFIFIVSTMCVMACM
jgi:hypothetical protein